MYRIALSVLLLPLLTSVGHTQSTVSGPNSVYGQGYTHALQHQLPLVVGVGCVPPSCNLKDQVRWLTVTTLTLEGFHGPCVVISKASKGGDHLIWVATLPASATSADVVASLNSQPTTAVPVVSNYVGQSYTYSAPYYPPSQPTYYQPSQGYSNYSGGGGIRCVGGT